MSFFRSFARRVATSTASRMATQTTRTRRTGKPQPVQQDNIPFHWNPERGLFWDLPHAPEFPGWEIDFDALDAPTAPDDRAALIEALEVFGISASVEAVRAGAIVTVYEIQLAGRAKVQDVERVAEELCLRLSAVSVNIRRVPGSQLVRVELAGKSRKMIEPFNCFNTLLERSSGVKGEYPEDKKQWAKLLDNNIKGLPVVIGETVDGLPAIYDLARLPHLLVAGTTGSGKSVLLNTILLSLIVSNSPDRLKLALIDPKILEFTDYKHVPHLGAPIVHDSQAALEMLETLCDDMDNRYKAMARAGVRSLKDYNARAADADKLPYIVCVIDEYADLVSNNRKAVENAVQRLAQKARAAGIHLILATQRPSADVLTSVIKSNFPARIAMKVSSVHDSRTIINRSGAENLMGHGDMIFLHETEERLHCPFVSDDTISTVTAGLAVQKAREMLLYQRDVLGGYCPEMRAQVQEILRLPPLCC